jgi:hypothetical protein
LTRRRRPGYIRSVNARSLIESVCLPVLSLPGALRPILCGWLLALAATSAHGAVLAQYLVAAGQSDELTLAPNLVHPSVSASPITGAGGLIALNLNTFAFGGFVNTPLVEDPALVWPNLAYGTQALEITITPAPGQQIRFDSVEYVFLTIHTGMTFEVRTSLNNFTTPINGPHTLANTGAGEEIASLAALPLISGPITFRWYAYSSALISATNPFAGFADNTGRAVRFNGTIISAFTPQITAIERIGSNVRIGFTSQVGSNYRVEFRPDLIAGSWQPLAANIPGTGGVVQFIDLGALSSGRKFYRIAPP